MGVGMRGLQVKSNLRMFCRDTHHSCHVGEADDVWGDFDQLGLRKCSSYIVDGAQDRSVGRLRTAYKLKGDATGLGPHR